MIEAHGGALVDRVLQEEVRRETERRAIIGEYPRIDITTEQAKTVENLATGVYSPLEGFMTKAEAEKVLSENRLLSGEAWTIPVLFDLKEAEVRELKFFQSNSRECQKTLEASPVALWHNELPLALLWVEEAYTLEKAVLAGEVYGTLDKKHPGVQKVYSQGDYFLGGKIDLINFTRTPYALYKLTPAQTRALFKNRGWQTIVAFQTRNAPHLGHEYVQKTALTFADGLFINPVIGKKKKGDFSDQAIIDSYLVLLDKYYRKENTALSILEYEMQYGGPKEAIHHAIIRKNFGCTHFIVGRDHAGVGSYYGPYDAQKIFQEFPDLGIVPVNFSSFFFCKRCNSVANDKICPHGPADHIEYSGTRIREFFEEGGESLEDLMRREVIEAIKQHEEPFVC